MSDDFGKYKRMTSYPVSRREEICPSCGVVWELDNHPLSRIRKLKVGDKTCAPYCDFCGASFLFFKNVSGDIDNLQIMWNGKEKTREEWLGDK